MFKFSISIKTQLIITFMIISTIVISFTSYLNFNSNVTKTKENFIENSRIQAELLADFTVSALAFGDIEGINENIGKISGGKEVLQIIVFDENQKRITSYNPNNLSIPKKIKKDEIYIEGKSNLFVNIGNLKIFVPIKQNENIYGTLYIEKSSHIIKNELKNIFFKVLSFAFLFLVITYFISSWLSNYFLKPIFYLSNMAIKIATSRNYRTRVNYEVENEIGTLFKAFNMLLQDTENLTTDLEDKIGRRTKELEKSLKELKNTQDQLVESEKLSALGNLVTGLAHEVNTPLGNALTTSSIITKESEELINALNTGNLKKSVLTNKLGTLKESSILIVSTLKYASNLIKSFKQISADQITNDIRSFNLKKYLEEIFLTNHSKLKKIPVDTEFIYENDIFITTTPGVIGQIFNNFIQNSIVHGFDRKSENAKIIVTLKKENNNITIIYEDNGHGIDEKIKSKAFEPFVTTKRNRGGTGLGLNIVHNLVLQKLNGTIKLESQKEEYARFTIQIPQIRRETSS